MRVPKQVSELPKLIYGYNCDGTFYAKSKRNSSFIHMYRFVIPYDRQTRIYIGFIDLDNVKI